MRVAHIQKKDDLVINIGIDSELITTNDFYMVDIQDREDVIPGMTYQDGEFVFVERSPVPESVTSRQARLALFQNGLLSSVEQIIQSLPGDAGELARIEWNHASNIERSSPLISSLGPILNLSVSDIDDLFRLAGEL